MTWIKDRPRWVNEFFHCQIDNGSDFLKAPIRQVFVTPLQITINGL